MERREKLCYWNCQSLCSRALQSCLFFFFQFSPLSLLLFLFSSFFPPFSLLSLFYKLEILWKEIRESKKEKRRKEKKERGERRKRDKEEEKKEERSSNMRGRKLKKVGGCSSEERIKLFLFLLLFLILSLLLSFLLRLFFHKTKMFKLESFKITFIFSLFCSSFQSSEPLFGQAEHVL